MKMTTTTFLALFLLSAFTSFLPSATAFVVDTDGKPLRNGGVYYLMPVIITGNGGGVEFAATGNETCPLTVVQNPSPFANGLPVQISSPLKVLYIGESTILNIGFTFVLPCAPTPSEWTVVNGLGEELAVKLTGYDDTVPGWFRIKRVPVDVGGYNILFCPTDGSACGYVSTESEARRLVVSQNEGTRLWVRFQSLSSASAAIATATATA